MSDLGDTTPEGHRFKRGVGNSSSTAVSSFLSLRRLGLFWYFSSGGEGKRLAPVRLRAHRAAAPSFSFKKPRGSPPALRGAGREAPAWGVTYRSAATGAPRAPRPNRAGAAARLLRCPPRLRLHLPPLSQDLPEAWTVAPGGGGGSEGGGGAGGSDPVCAQHLPMGPRQPRPSPGFPAMGRPPRRPFRGGTVSLSVYSFPMAIAPPSLSTSGTWPGAVLVTLKFLLQLCQI